MTFNAHLSYVWTIDGDALVRFSEFKVIIYDIGNKYLWRSQAYVNDSSRTGAIFHAFSNWKCGFSAGRGSVDLRVLLNERRAKGNQIINLKEDNGSRKAHVKFSLLITTSHTMEALPALPRPEIWRSLPCFKLSPSRGPF